MTAGLADARLGHHNVGLDNIRDGLEEALKFDVNRLVLFGMQAEAEATLLSGDLTKALDLIDQALGRARQTEFSRLAMLIEGTRMKMLETTPKPR